METFIYVRVSSAAQKDNYSFAAQKKDGVSFAESIGSDYRLYKDVESGKVSSREDWTRLKADLLEISEPGDVVWYGSQSRLMRDSLEFQTFKKICIDKKLRLFEKTEKRYIDFAASSGDRIVAGIKAIISEEEVAEINRRTREGLYDSFDKGERNHNRLFGYKTVFNDRGKKVYEVVPEHAEMVRMAFKMLAKRSTTYSIVKRLNESGIKTRGGKYWDVTKLKNMFRHITYTGRTYDSRRNIIPSKKYPPIVDIELFDSVAPLIERRSGLKGRPFHYEGSGLMKCRFCNAGYHHHKMRGFHYYVHNDSDKCDGAKTRIYEIVNYIISDAYATALLNYPKSIFAELKAKVDIEESELKSSLKQIDKLIRSEETKVENFTEAVAFGKNIVFYNDLIEKSLREIAICKSNKVRVAEEISLKSKDLESIYASYSLENLTRYFEATTTDDRKEMLKRIVKTVWMDKDTIQVDLIDGRKVSYSYNETKSKWQELDIENKKAGNVTWKKELQHRLSKGSQEEKLRAIKYIIEHNNEYFAQKRIDLSREITL